MNAADIFILVNVAMSLFVAIWLTQAWRQKNMQNLLWLAILFYSNAVFNLTALTSLNVPYTLFNVIKITPLGIPFGFRIGAFISQFSLVMFITQTFYQGKKSPFNLFRGMTVAVIASGLILTLLVMNTSTFANYDWLAYGGISLMTIANWGWHTFAAYRGYAAITGDAYVEDWVKTRYQLMIASGIIAALASVATRFVDLWVPWRLSWQHRLPLSPVSCSSWFGSCQRVIAVG